MRGPLLLITGGRDHAVSELTVRATLRRYRHPHAVTDIKNLPDRAHSLTIDGGWRMVAIYRPVLVEGAGVLNLLAVSPGLFPPLAERPVVPDPPMNDLRSSRWVRIRPAPPS
ncbi:hypothetical protein SAMN05216276_102576 [Streptosporangium subroseum]|uniref:Uncharacterized protein n=1 Tax=Streptosporangium subroseum TaxID=106412 RepID=A0A239K472_9ACTN|nr:hypothetical protein SAMN05216276_102576 [Streptosporangium subroseum]